MNIRNDRDLDDLLSDDAGRIGTAYRKLSKMEPPRRLDRNVLAQASRAVHGRPRSSFWLLGIGTAAGVLLAAGIAWRVNHDMVNQRQSVPASAPATETIPSGVIRVEPRDSSDSKDKGSETVGPPDEQLESGDADAESASGSGSLTRPNPNERKAAQENQKLDRALASDPTIKETAPKPTQESANKAEAIRAQAAPIAPPAPASPAAAPPMRSPMPEETRDVQTRRGGSEAQGSMASEPMQKTQGASQTAADSSNISTREGARSKEESSFDAAAVTAEIDRIRALLRAGEREQAIKALRELRRLHPEFVLPADLRVTDG